MKKGIMKGFLAMAALMMVCGTANAQLSSFFFGSGKRINASGNYVTKEYRVSDFNKINLACAADVVYTQKSGTPTVKAYVSDNVATILEVKVSGGTLDIRYEKGYNVNNNNKTFRIELSSETLEGVDLSGSGSVKFGQLATGRLDLDVSGSGEIECGSIVSKGSVSAVISGSGDIDIDRLQSSDLTARVTGSGEMEIEGITTGKVNAKVTGSGEISLKGSGTDATYAITGSGDIEAKGLRTANVEADITGSGDITCYASQYLKADVSGSGTISYAGKPSKTDIPRRKVRAIE